MTISDRATSATPRRRIRLRCTTRVFGDWLSIVVYLAWLGVGVDLIVQGVTGDDVTTPLAMGSLIVVVFTFLMYMLAAVRLRSLIVADGHLLIPKTFSRATVPLSRLSGVGLIYQREPGARRPSGWQLHVWDGDVDIQVDNIGIITGRGPKKPATGRRFGAKLNWNLPLPHEDAGFLGATRQGRVARRIYEIGLDWQGPGGPLATRAMQKEIVYDARSMTIRRFAWWSPDNTMCRAAGVPIGGPAKAPSARGSAPNAAAVPARPPRSPELARARARYLFYVLADAALFVALAVVAFVTLGRAGYLEHGELCRPALSAAPKHPSAACDAWRHHHLMLFSQIAVMIGVLIVAVIVLLVRAQRKLQRLTIDANA
jgi:hypothetical protein